ncbi:MAG: DUF6494 family protein [Gammaproteobacteria bacterium]
MNEDTLNLEIRRFLKKVGITSQREVEGAVRKAISDGRLAGHERLAVKVTLEVRSLGVRHEIEDDIALE